MTIMVRGLPFTKVRVDCWFNKNDGTMSSKNDLAGYDRYSSDSIHRVEAINWKLKINNTKNVKIFFERKERVKKNWTSKQ